MPHIFYSCLLILFLFGCSEKKEIHILSWNIQNLFDATDDENDYKEFTSSKGWNEKAYQNRLKKVAQIINKANSPEIVCLIEIENGGVLETLSSSWLSNKGYHPYFIGPKKGIGFGILSKIPISRIHGLGLNYSRQELRPILLVDFTLSGKTVTLALTHLKSMRGDETGTQNLRNLGLNSLALALQNRPYSLICGDFNQDTIPKIGKLSDIVPLNQQEIGGTYFYNKEWSNLDHFFASPSVKIACKILDFPELFDPDGHPFRFQSYSLKGLSDHLPLLASIGLEDTPKDLLE